MPREESKWVRGPGKMNSVLECEGFFVSYNPVTGSLGSFWAGDGTGEETALCKDGGYLILNGDFRAEYEKAAPRGYEACRAIYEANRGVCRSSWSDDAA